MVFEPALMALAIRHCHSSKAPVLFDQHKDIKATRDDMGEPIRIVAAMVRELRNSAKKREVAFKSVSFMLLTVTRIPSVFESDLF